MTQSEAHFSRVAGRLARAAGYRPGTASLWKSSGSWAALRNPQLWLLCTVGSLFTLHLGLLLKDPYLVDHVTYVLGSMGLLLATISQFLAHTRRPSGVLKLRSWLWIAFLGLSGMNMLLAGTQHLFAPHLTFDRYLVQSSMYSICLLAVITSAPTALPRKARWLELGMTCAVALMLYFSFVRVHFADWKEWFWFTVACKLYIAVAAVLAVWTSNDPADFQLSMRMAVYLIASFVFGDLINYDVVHPGLMRGNRMSFLFLVSDYALIAVTLFRPRMRLRAAERTTTYMLLNSQPLLLALAVIGLGLYVMEHRPFVATGAIVFASVSYGIRSTLMQTSQMLERDALQQGNEMLKYQVKRDPLTGTGNRLAFDDALERTWLLHQRPSARFALLLCDVDHFKRINDGYGHPSGDACLIAVANAVRHITGDTWEHFARIGGDEFALILPNTNLGSALAVASEIRSAVADAMNGFSFPATLSIGVAVMEPEKHKSTNDLLQAADEALYLAKVGGRDRAAAAR